MRKIRRNSQESFTGKSGENVDSYSEEFLEAESQNCDPPKISYLWDQFWGISREFLRSQLQNMILEKFLGNSTKKVTTFGESGKIPHFCYLGFKGTLSVIRTRKISIYKVVVISDDQV